MRGWRVKYCGRRVKEGGGETMDSGRRGVLLPVGVDAMGLEGWELEVEGRVVGVVVVAPVGRGVDEDGSNDDDATELLPE